MTRPQSTVVSLSGNPRAGSRTSTVAKAVATAIATALPASLSTPATPTELELADLAASIFGPDRSPVDDALAVVASASALVVATPVYKASYTGLLKAFLDGYGPGALRGVVAVPIVISASPAHSFAGEVHLRPLLVELGATVPVRALAITESELADLASRVSVWSQSDLPQVVAAVAASSGVGVAA